MGYMRDKGTHRGVGAIAAIDGVGRRRAREQARKNRVMAKIDARHAQLAWGPGRKLPVPLGRISLTSDGGAGAGGATTTTATRTVSAPVISEITSVATAPVPTPTPTTAVASPIIATMSQPVASPVIATYTPSYPTNGIIVEPAPISTATGGTKAPYVPPKSTGTGSGLAPSVPVPPQFTAPSTPVDLPEPSSSLSTKTIVMVGAGIGLLWLLTRDKND